MPRKLKRVPTTGLRLNSRTYGSPAGGALTSGALAAVLGAPSGLVLSFLSLTLLSRSVSVESSGDTGESLWAVAKVAVHPIGTAQQSINSNTREYRLKR